MARQDESCRGDPLPENTADDTAVGASMKSAVSDASIRQLRRSLVRWEKDNFAEFPWRACHNHWHCIAAEVMLRRTAATQVVPVFQWFAAKYETAEAFADDNEAAVFGQLGLRQREREFRKLAETLRGKRIPREPAKLLELPGVGPYVAAAYRCFHLHIRDVIVDTNVVRLYGRYWGFETDGGTRRKRWFIELAERVTPRRRFWWFNYALLDFTREICNQRPKCDECPFSARSCALGRFAGGGRRP